MHEELKEHLPYALTIVHGACPNSADEMASAWCKEFDEEEEPHPSQSGDYLARNSRMVDSGIDLVVALWDGKSRGTLDTITKAVKQGIPVHIV
jgi:hypothetical protein